jgi:hypothetical protein
MLVVTVQQAQQQRSRMLQVLLCCQLVELLT